MHGQLTSHRSPMQVTFAHDVEVGFNFEWVRRRKSIKTPDIKTPELLGQFIHNNAPVEGADLPIGSKVELRKTVLPPTSISTS